MRKLPPLASWFWLSAFTTPKKEVFFGEKNGIAAPNLLFNEG
jgi:hypothetical protein